MGYYTSSDDGFYTTPRDFMNNFLNQLQDFQPAGRNFADTFTADNQTYFADSDALVNKQTFWGKGAQAFLASVSKQISDSDPLVRGLRHLSSQTASYYNTLDTLTTQCTNQLAQVYPFDSPYTRGNIGSLRDALVSNTMENLDLNTILQSGATAISGPLATAESTVQGQASNAVESFFNDLRSLANKQTEQADTLFIQDQVSSAAILIKPILEQWADGLCHATKQYGSNILNADNYITAGDLYTTIFHPGEPGPRVQDTSKPIQITAYTMPDGSTRLVVSIAGTDAIHQNYANNFLNAIPFGVAPSGNAPYLKDVQNALQTYLHEHPDIKNPHVTLAGYSLGGMVAQYLASSSAAQSNHTFDSVVTFGSPLMGPPAPGVNYKLYMGTGDIVPLLSGYEAFNVRNLPFAVGELSEGKDPLNDLYHKDWNYKLHQYIDPQNQYGNRIIPISDLPYANDSDWDEIVQVLPNHTMYSQSNVLENSTISMLNGATQKGIPEYFPVSQAPNGQPIYW